MSQNPVVSILVPLYNHEKFIVSCLDSLIEDGYPAKEIIIIDDGSTDNSVALVQDWYNRNAIRDLVRIEFLSQQNMGVTKTLNALLTLAQGEFVILIASDDYLLPGGIRARLDYLLSHTDKMAVFADCVVVDAENAVLHSSGIDEYYGGRKNILCNEQLLPYEIVFNWTVPGPVFMARRAVYDVIGTYDESIAVEDWDFYLRLVAQNLLGFVDVPVAAYRIHGSNSIKNMAVRYKQTESLMQTAGKNSGLFTGIRKYKLLSRMLYYKSELAKMDGNKCAAKLYLWVGKRINKLVTRLYKNKIESCCR